MNHSQQNLNNKELKILSKWALSIVLLAFFAVLLTSAGVGVSTAVMLVRTKVILRGSIAANCINHTAECVIRGSGASGPHATCATGSLSTTADVSCAQEFSFIE